MHAKYCWYFLSNNYINIQSVKNKDTNKAFFFKFCIMYNKLYSFQDY